MEQTVLQTVNTSEEVLIQRILAGEKRLFEQIIRHYNPRLFRIGMSILGNDMEVEDAMQNAYVSAYEHLEQFQQRSSFGTWLTRIMLNECFAQKKKKARIMQLAKQQKNDISMTTPITVLANKELSLVLERAISVLPEKYRLVFVLREIEEMSVKDTSDTLSIAESNVKVRLNRAKTMLRESLTGYMKENVYSFHLIRCDRVVANVFARLGI